MVTPREEVATAESSYDRAEELKAFNETKAGVKAMVDSGLLKVPKLFIRPSGELNHKSDSNPTHFHIPVIDLHGMEEDEKFRETMVDEIKSASEKWGFFQVVNHGVPLSVLDGMMKGVIRFNEQDDDVKKQYHTCDQKMRVRFNYNFELNSKSLNWRDSLTFFMKTPDPLEAERLPATCRDITVEYSKHVTTLGDTLFELLSEALGLKSEHLKEMQCGETCTLVCHYYPSCPEPELTLGSARHTDPTFLTILLQDDIGGLQVRHQDNWVNVHPVPGALVVNIGDFLQIASNDKIKSAEHRVLANRVGPRVSVASFLTTRSDMDGKIHGPIKELISVECGPIYRDISTKEYMGHFYSQGLDGKSILESLRSSPSSAGQFLVPNNM